MTAPMTLARLAEIDDRLAGITPGPWRVGAEGSEGSRVNPDTGDKRTDSRYILTCNGRAQPEDGRNAQFVAHAPQDISDLRAEVDRLRGRVTAAKSLHVPVENAIAKWCDHDKTAWPCPTIAALDPPELHHEWWIGCESRHPENGAECVRMPAKRPHISAGGYQWDDPTASDGEAQA